jgi:WhiB family transcriptional regulator, redox-sensing transcriptional regulator
MRLTDSRALSWITQGACRDSDPELFFPVSIMGPGLDQADRAKAVCGCCLVRWKCLAYAMTTRQTGIWGGTTDNERRLMRARERRHAARAHENLAARTARQRC